MTVGGNSLGPRRLLSTALLLAVAAMFLVTPRRGHRLQQARSGLPLGLPGRCTLRAGRRIALRGCTTTSSTILYPPVLAEALVPLTVLPDDVSSFFAFAASVAAVMGALAVVGVRDVRCYAAVVIWAPAWNTFEIANVTGLLTLLSAVVWRYRDARWRSAAALGAALCLKLFLWPLAVWAAATRRLRIAGAALTIGVGLALVSWAVIDFTGFTSYPDVLRGQPFEDSYSLVGIAAALGLDQGVGRVATAVVGGSLLAATVHLGRRQEEQRAFLCAIFASLALSPVLWLHYFAVLSRAVGDCSSALLRPLAAADSPLDVPTFRERRWCAALRSGDSRLRVYRRARALAECRPSGVGSAGVTTEARPIAGRPWPPRTLTLSRITWLASIVFFGALPALVLALLAIDVHGETIAIDLHQFYDAAQAILDGSSPYPPNGEPTTPLGGPYPYPPLPALLLTPLSLLPLEVAGAVLMALLVCAALAVPFVLGVRDWRCYGLALLWPPVISAIQTGNLTLWLALACASPGGSVTAASSPRRAIGITLAAKFFLWPLVVWFAATRRSASAVLACASVSALLLASWAVIGFAGFVDYPHLLRRLDGRVGDDSYTPYIVGLDLGLPVAASPVASGSRSGLRSSRVVALARRGDERTAFIVAIAASLALTPIVWLHYFALLLVVVALAQPRLGLVVVRAAGVVRHAGKRAPDAVRDGLGARGRATDHCAVRAWSRAPSGDASGSSALLARRGETA